MQMLQWEKSVCVNVTVALTYTTPQRQRVLSEAYFKHSPRAVCACSGHVCLSACIFHSASDLSPTGPEENDSTHQTAHLHLNVHRFYPSNFPHGSGIPIHTGDPT